MKRILYVAGFYFIKKDTFSIKKLHLRKKKNDTPVEVLLHPA